MDKKQREAMRKQEDQALNRGLLWVGAAILLEGLLLFVNRYYLNFRGGGFEAHLAGFLYSGMCLLAPVGAAAAVACLAWTLVRSKNGAGLRLPVALMCAFGALAFCSHVVVHFGEQGMQMLYLLVAAWAGLALVYHIYQREFFLAAAAGGLGTVGLWFVRYGGPCLEAVAALAGLAVLAALIFLRKQEKRSVVALASCLMSAAAVAAAMVLGAGAAYYLIFAMMAWLFALLVYYTVKMM